MKILVIGTCRVSVPFSNCSHFKVARSKIGHIHSSSQVVQSFSIMNGKLNTSDFSDYIRKKFFMGVKKKKILRKIDISKINKFIIEISSLKNYIFYYQDKKIFSPRFIDNNSVLETENEKNIYKNLIKINNIVKHKPIIFVSHNNIPKLKNRDLIINVVKKFCKEKNKIFVDPTYILKHCKKNISQCFLLHKDNSIDYNHYSAFSNKEIRKNILKLVY